MTVTDISIEHKKMTTDKQAFFNEFSDLLKKYDVEFEIEFDDNSYSDYCVNGIEFNFNSHQDVDGNPTRQWGYHVINGQYHDYTNYIVDIKD